MMPEPGRRSLFWGLAALAGLLILPFALRPRGEASDVEGEVLVVLTPHNEAIRYEFGHGFAEHMQKVEHRRVRIDWRNPGGTAEIARYLNSEYRAAFELDWTRQRGQEWSERVALAFANPVQSTHGDDEAARARRTFLGSRIGIKVDVLFGGGSYDFKQHAEAGRLVDSGYVSAHPELFNEQVIPQKVGGEPYWDPQGRWIGATVSGLGICYSPDTLERLGIDRPPERWSDLADPAYLGQIALADPSKSGSAAKAFEMLLQQAMAEGQEAAPGDPAALGRGFDQGLLLVRQIAGNSRYFTDSANKIPQDIAQGSAAAGMCIDFYGRFQSEASGGSRRLTFVLPTRGSSLGADPIALLRGAPSPELARKFIDYVLSPAGQALWAFKLGVPGGPKRYALRRLPILPALYAPSFEALRSDPDDNPYLAAQGFEYHGAWTGPLFRALSFAVRVMCVDTEDELHTAWAALVKHGFPPAARERFEQMKVLSYERLKNEVAPILARGEPLDEVELGNRLVTDFKLGYEEVTRLAEAGR